MDKPARVLGSAIVACCLAFSGAGAAGLRVGTRAAPSLDPHFLFLSTTVAYSRHIYDLIVVKDVDGSLKPGLATSWEPIEPTRWRFHLRKGVKFHDGSDFTAEDVKFSLERVPNVPNNPGPFTGNLKSVIGTEIKDPYTIDVLTSSVNPLIPQQFGNIFVVSKKLVEGKDSRDFTSGAVAIGTGPYRFVSFTPGQSLVVRRNDDYWGGKQPWDEVTFRLIPNDAARVAALLAGDIDLADFIPPSDVPSLRENKNITVHTGPSNRTIYLVPNSSRDKLADVLDLSGKPLDTNPFKDIRIRKALSLAIDRTVIVERVMGGLAIPASQIVPPGMVGYDKDRPVQKADPAGAKKLLAEAGYPGGFSLTLTCTNDRYLNDAKLCQGIGQMLARGGFAVKIVTEPGNLFFGKAKAPSSTLGLAMVGWGSAGEADAIWNVLHTYDRDLGFGAFNSIGYSNKDADRFADAASLELDVAKRAELERKSMAASMDDYGAIPVHVQTIIVASRKGIAYTPNVAEYTLATEARPVP